MCDSGISRKYRFCFDLLISSLEVFEYLMFVPNVSGNKLIGDFILLSFLFIFGNVGGEPIVSDIKLEVDDFLGLSTGLLGGFMYVI